MNVTNEIKNKEKTLAELMVRILKEPLDPLKVSVKKLNDDVLDTKDKVDEISDVLNATVSTEELIKPLRRTLRELQDDDIPKVMLSLQNFISQDAEEKSKYINTLISQQTLGYETQLNNSIAEVIEKISNTTGQQNDAIQQYRQAVLDGTEALFQQLLTVKKSLQDACASNISEQLLVRERDQELVKRLDSVRQDQQQIKQSISEFDHQLQGVGQNVQTAWAALMERQGSERREMLSRLEMLSTGVQSTLIRNFAPLTQAVESLQTSQQMLSETVIEKNSHLDDKIVLVQGNLRLVIILFCLFAFSILAYIGYDIWRNLAS